MHTMASSKSLCTAREREQESQQHYISAQRLLRETWSSSCQISLITGPDTAAGRTMRLLTLTVRNITREDAFRNHHLTVARCRRLSDLQGERSKPHSVLV